MALPVAIARPIQPIGTSTEYRCARCASADEARRARRRCALRPSNADPYSLSTLTRILQPPLLATSGSSCHSPTSEIRR
eukprot:4269004-Pleurochrysis_carterae.AAC.1